MGPTDLVVEQGTPDDVAEAVALLDGARRWLHDRSIDQWQHAIPAEVVVADAERGELFVVRGHHGVQAIVTVTDHDPETWGTDSTPALYVHRLAVAQASRGQGLGQALLGWTSARAADQRKSFVRLDCADDNHGLRRFYETQGFQHVRDTTVTAPGGARSLGSSLSKTSGQTHTPTPPRNPRVARRLDACLPSCSTILTRESRNHVSDLMGTSAAVPTVGRETREVPAESQASVAGSDPRAVRLTAAVSSTSPPP